VTETTEHQEPAWPADDPLLHESWHARARTFVDLFWVFPGTLYALTACRGVGWVDCANHIRDVWEMSASSWVNNHNLFFALGRLWLLVVPIGPPAFSLNLFAGLWGAVTVTFLFWTALALTRNLVAATSAAFALMFSHALWWHSTLVEVYTLNTAILSIMLWLVLRWTQTRSREYLYGAVFALGVGISNHVLMALFVPAFLLLFALPWERELRQWGVFATGLAALLLGAQLWLIRLSDDFANELGRSATHWEEQTPAVVYEAASKTLRRASGARFYEVISPEDQPASVAWRWRAKYVGLLALNYPSIALPAGLFGLWTLARDRPRRTFAVFFAAAIGIQALWSSNYFVWDMFAFGLPVWVLFAVPVAHALDVALRREGVTRRRALALLPTVGFAPVLYLLAAAETRDDGRLAGVFTGLGKNLYDAGEFLVSPSKRGFTQTEDVLQAYATVLPGGAQLWDSESKGYFPFHNYYQEVLGGRRDVTSHLIFGPFLDEAKAEEHAAKLRNQLESGERVFISSLLAPERLVLSKLYRDLAGDEAPPLRTLLRQSPDEFASAFPRYRFVRVELPNTDGAYIFEIVARR
jgi:Protein of unknown function (DUF2723)